MKVSSLLLLIFFISEIEATLIGFDNYTCTDYRGTGINQQAYSRDFCRSLGINAGYAQCCFVKYKISGNTFYNCIQLTIGQFYDMDTAKEYARTHLGAEEIKSLECTSSSYLYGSFLLLLFILF